DHPDPRRRWARRRAVLCRAVRTAARGRGNLFSGGQCRCALTHKIIPPRLRRRSIVVLRPPAALRTLLFRRSRAACRHALRHLREGSLYRPHHRPAGQPGSALRLPSALVLTRARRLITPPQGEGLRSLSLAEAICDCPDPHELGYTRVRQTIWPK